MVKKEDHDGVTRYYCGNCGSEMFSFLNNMKRFTRESEVLFKKYLNYLNIKGPYYTCQYCGSIHMINYSDNNIFNFVDFGENKYDEVSKQ